MSGKTTSRKVVTAPLYRVRKGKEKTFAAAAEAPVSGVVPRPSALSIRLALAHKIQRAIDAGEIKDRAEVARRLGVSRARVTQIMDLALLPIAAQEQVLGSQLLAQTV